MRLTQRSIAILATVLLTAMAGCSRNRTVSNNEAAKTAAEVDYQSPPEVKAARIVSGQVEVTGAASPKAIIRLAKPNGPAGQTLAARDGRWAIRLPVSSQVEMYGVSEAFSGRVLQASGYLLVTPGGLGVVMRSGAGALVLSDREPARVTAMDIDREGGAVVSGFSAPGSRVSAWIDGDKMGDGRVDSLGRFVLALSGPVSPGRHTLKVFGEDIDTTRTVDAGRATALTTGPFRTTQVGPHLRVDWMTPGGGEQTTWVYGQDTTAR